MKIAIMTQPLGQNYGGIMQAWALQQVLKNAGHDPVTIDRQSDAKSAAYYAARFGYRTAQKLLGKRKLPINYEKLLPYIFQHTQKFIAENIKMSERIDSTKKLKSHFDAENYDAVIVGSDQTWRPIYSPNINNYFLDFLENRKIKRLAYASSFGVDSWEFTNEQTKICAELAKKFDCISVRENSGVDLCKTYLDVEATQVLDPTMLIKREDYEKLCNTSINEKKGIYTYILDNSDWKDKVVRTVEEKLKLSRYKNQSETDYSKLTKYNLENFVFPKVEDWITGFAQSSLVITDSFHGTVFAIMFNKPFISLINNSRGASRFYSLLSSTDLEDRLISNYDEQMIDSLLNHPQNKFNIEINEKDIYKQSKSFLNRALKHI
ncbi:polysaccharide pyruvyl transferase family protein [Alcaligenes endophyticus]|uniref:Polysaccharide pyruvyl transferase family protein n=1 Tax=Alcaligenes endophyticus TaxID=1929088 RepID=A0ABT8EFP5_9BURK|nr:polysaccharide pyruvyl transferase family protein [Alcaligenes endophyticus]MCX5590208.1 polysaccharide pyruvyl transferase family protein [Alcaligenes endophyticus]MDN4120129.1 polysaccharide pyruvyl transferase family protein [Alcaligenes endophyticus]